MNWNGKQLHVETREPKKAFLTWNIGEKKFNEVFLSGKTPPVLVAMNNDQKNIKAEADHHNGSLVISFMVMLQECNEGGARIMKSFFTDFEPVKTLRPKSAAEVQEIIKKANKDKTPLVPVSSASNLQDTHLPTVKGAVAVDLSGLKGMYFDAANRNVTVEPGVTFADIEKQCAKAGLRTLTCHRCSQRMHQF